MKRLIEIIKGQQVSRFDETDLPLTLGSTDTAHIRVGKGRETLAYVGESRGHLFLQSADSSPTVYHNDEHLDGSVWLKSGDITRIGAEQLLWKFSGQRLEVHITRATAAVLSPPTEAPEPQADEEDSSAEKEKLITVSERRQSSRRLRGLVIGAFLSLIIAAAFVLLAKPLSIQISPVPDQVDVSGLPPVVELGDSYLGIIGRYQLRAVKEGYRELVEDVEITASGSRYEFSMEKLPGLIDVTTEPAGARLLIDGEDVGITPIAKADLDIGTRNLRFEHPRYLPVDRVIESAGLGEHQKLHVVLEPAWAVYTLQTEPPGAIVAVDGEELGKTPLEAELIAGQRQLSFTLEKYSPLKMEIDVVAGEDAVPDAFRLIPAPAAVEVTSDPSGATVSVDGAYLGRTPLTASLPSGKLVKLKVATAGYHPASRKLTLEAADQKQISLKLEPEYGTLFITATPPNATLLIDGRQQETANGRYRLTTRPHKLTLKAGGYESLTKTVTPQSGYSQNVEMTLVSKKQQSKPVVTAEKPKVTTALKQTLILVKPRSFVMGAARNEPGRRANESEREVNLQRSFYISSKEVTNAEFKRFSAQHSSGMVGNRSLEIDSHPVVNISWDDAARFMNWLSQEEGLPPFYEEVNGKMAATAGKGVGYRLPSEAEWAYSARMAGRKERARYAWPGKYPPSIKQGNYADESARHLLPLVIRGYDDGFAATAPVGSFAANPLGIFDLDGNVAEWCHDYYAAITAKGSVDPLGPSSGSHHLIRGASWRDASITELRLSYRRYSKEPASDVGFRIARYAE